MLDRGIKFVGLIESAGTLTPVWSVFRGARHKAVLGKTIINGYAELYAIYPDAHSRLNTDIGHVFSTNSTAGQQVVSKTVATFKALVAEAEFSSEATSTDTSIHTGPLHTAPRRPFSFGIEKLARFLPTNSLLDVPCPHRKSWMRSVTMAKSAPRRFA
ncbi:DUF5343 domain-containing protein [Mycoplana azooxidifex]|uniref:DUF5343 domain-containing protein n=1 Tax=Mycoplana azooxidifex TaxID=1636188 RepID=UPI00161A7909